MSASIQPSLIRRLRFTPLRDIVRGRLSGRLDAKNRIEVAPIPAEAKRLIARVVRQTRLGRLEKADVADELIEHFATALEGGATPEGLIEHFGNERLAARLIRRAKKRNRPLTERVMRALGWFFAASLAFYIGVAIYFFAGTPSVKVNYADLLNQQMERTPPDQRGWPLYRQAMSMLGDRDQRSDIWSRKQSSGSANWLHAHADALELIRQAAAKPVFGYRFRAEDAPQSVEVAAGKRPPDSNPPLELLSLNAPYINTLVDVEVILLADMRLAQEEDDGARFVRDFDALSNMARQLRGDVSSQFISRSMEAWQCATGQVSDTLWQSPRLLSDEQLVHIAHRLAEPTSAADLIDPSIGTPCFLDWVQRIYTESADGDGRITPAGLQGNLAPLSRWLTNPDRALRTVIWPWSLIVTPSRKTVIERYQRLLQLEQEKLRLPCRLANWREFDNAPEFQRDSLMRGAFAFDSGSNPSSSASNRAGRAEVLLGNRDGVVVAIAAEMYRRQHGVYPTTLEALVPQFLPQIPADRITGEPVHYRLGDGKPVIYSVGADRVDDGGRQTVNRYGLPEVWTAARWMWSPKDVARGDWVLFPNQPDGNN